MIKAILPSVLLLACLGCAGPTIASRTVHSEGSWLIRLDTFADAQKASALLYDHPADWTEADLNAILSRLLVQERVGLLEQKPPPRSVFSSGEIGQLVPKLQEAFRMARLSEWVGVFLTRSTGPTQEITSGGFFLKGRELHVVIANHRKQVPLGHDGADVARANPLRSLGGKGGALTFDPPVYALATQSSWMGGYFGAPAAEMVLDYQAFLRDVRPPAPAPVASPPPPRTEITAVPPPTPSQKPGSEAGDTSFRDQAAALSKDVERFKRKLEEQEREIAQLKALLQELDMQKKEMERLQQKSEEQETEIGRLKARLGELEAAKRKPTTKKPAR